MNDMAANVAQCKRSNIKCYASAFNNNIDLDTENNVTLAEFECLGFKS